jgi:redox-sensitive bicupin YhaK (pirin superfamily)
MSRRAPRPAVDVRRAGDRFRTRAAGIDSRHCFSFGPHYDPGNTHFGLLLAANEDVVQAGSGFGTHPHRDIEIVTWVLEGSVVHEDSTGRTGQIHPGLAQRMSAGTGILHAERNADARRPARVVQMWVVPDTPGGTPGYEQREVGTALDSGELVVVASGRRAHAADRAVSIRQGHAALHAARLRPGGSTRLPSAPLLHLFVARGAAELEGTGVLHTGDAGRLTAGDGQRVVAGAEGAEVLVWEMHATLGAAGGDGLRAGGAREG